ncbi:MAG: alanyl-tRNA editing protein [Acidobacteria bacterium]|nr:MAG: alanyl-tRNA editing protein [Acidobacteriota bacterium]
MKRLYYEDSFLLSFDATVTASAMVDGAAHVRLEATAFYPTSGGQPHDVGTLNERAVIDVIDDEATGDVVHVMSGAPAFAVGDKVHGEIDRVRRVDHMQQHTGQHVLSAAFDRLFGVRTVSFHMGTASSTIDLAREVSAAEIERAALEANRVVWDDRSVVIRYATEAEAAAMPLRKESQRSGVLRLVEVPDFDLSACGGTHVARTGMIGIIVVSGAERFKGGTRLSFLCGGRALSGYNALRDVTTAVSRGLSIGVAELPDAVARMAAEIKDQKRQVKQLQEEVTARLAGELRETAVAGRVGRVVVRDQPGWHAAAIKFLASAVVSVPGFIVVLTGEGSPVPVVVARSADVSFDAGAWMKDATAAMGGRGGGRPEMAQGGLAAGTSDILARAKETLS